MKKIITRERKRLAYSITTKQIFGLDSSVPEALRSQIPAEWSGHLAQFHIRAENSGAQILKDVNVLIVTKSDSQIKFFQYVTNPPREVPVGTSLLEKPNELRVPNITLARNQSIEIDVFIRSPTQPDLQLFWSGGDGDVDWRIASTQEAFGIERNIISAIKYFIYAQIATPLVTSIMFAVSGVGSVLLPLGNQFTTVGAGIGAFLGNLLTLYFYIQMVPHALTVAKELMSRPHLSLKMGNIENSTAVTSSAIATASSTSGIQAPKP